MGYSADMVTDEKSGRPEAESPVEPSVKEAVKPLIRKLVPRSPGAKTPSGPVEVPVRLVGADQLRLTVTIEGSRLDHHIQTVVRCMVDYMVSTGQPVPEELRRVVELADAASVPLGRNGRKWWGTLEGPGISEAKSWQGIGELSALTGVAYPNLHARLKNLLRKNSSEKWVRFVYRGGWIITAYPAD
jgi:hypothetical protein